MYATSPNFSDLLKPDCEVKRFPDGENYVRIPRAPTMQGQDVALFHRLYPDQDSALVQAFLLLSVLKKANAKATLVAPYLPYSRQDKAWLDGEAISAEEICRMLADSGAKKLVTLDCHFLKKPGTAEYGGLKIENISMADRLVAHAEKLAGGKLETVSPDQGASYMADMSMKKTRGDYAKGQEAYRKVEKLEADFDVSGKDVLIIDDMIASGGTMIRAVENLKKGKAKRVFCAATHGFFLKGSLEKLKGCCDGVFVTDSIPSAVSDVKIMDVLSKYAQ